MTPPNIQPKIKTELIVALTSLSFLSETVPNKSFTATGRYTDMSVLTTPPNMLLTKQMVNRIARAGRASPLSRSRIAEVDAVLISLLGCCLLFSNVRNPGADDYTRVA